MYEDFVMKLIELEAELHKAIFKMDYNGIERYSLRIGKLITRFLNENKMTIEK